LEDLNYSDDNKLLVCSLKDGDKKAFAKLYHHFVPRLYNHVFRICKSETLSEDVVHDVFVKVWENRQTLNENLSFQSYLFTIAKNHLLNLIKRASREQDICNEILLHSRKSCEYTDHVVRFNETNAVLNEAIEKLSPQKKIIFKLCKNEGLTYEEIATKLGIAKGTVNVQVVSALKSIDDYLTINGIYQILILLFIYF
jgi:RNA polymerase sigma-70 factor (family 1)